MTFAVELFTLLSLGIAVVLFRTYARWKLVSFKGLEADDYLMLLALVPYVMESTLAYIALVQTRGLTNGGMTDEERRTLSPESDEYKARVIGSKIQVAGWIAYASTLWLVKAALCAFYIRLTAGLSGYRMRLIIGFGLIIVTYIVLVFCFLFSCGSITKYWQIHPNPGNLCQPALSKVYIFLTLVFNIATDIYLISIPVPMLWRMQLPTIKRIGLIVIFSGAAFVITAGIIRCTFIFRDEVTGPKEGASWAVRESFVAIAASSMPMIWALLRRWVNRFVSSALSSSKKTNGLEPGSMMLGESSNNNSSWQKHRTQATVTAHAAKGISNDDIVLFDDGGSEDGIIQKGGGIRKEVEVTVSSRQADSKQPEC